MSWTTQYPAATTTTGLVVLGEQGGVTKHVPASLLAGEGGGGGGDVDLDVTTTTTTVTVVNSAGDDALIPGATEEAAGVMSAADKAKLAVIASGADVTKDAIHNASSKSTPVDGDEFGLIDSAEDNAIKKLTFANLKTALGTPAPEQVKLAKKGADVDELYLSVEEPIGNNILPLDVATGEFIVCSVNSGEIASCSANDTGVPGARRTVLFTNGGVVLLGTHADKMILPNGSDGIVTEAGDIAQFLCLATDLWLLWFYQRAGGASLVDESLDGRISTLEAYHVDEPWEEPLALSDLVTPLTASGSVPVGYVDLAADTTFTSFDFSALTAPTGAALEFDVKLDGTSVFGTKPTIDAGEYRTGTAAVPQVLSTSSGNAGQRLTFFVTQIGSTIAGAGVQVRCKGFR